MRGKTIVYIALFCFLFFSCQSYDNRAWEIAKDCNNPELSKFLDYYKSGSDNEKYRAACFIVENMPNKSFIDPANYNLVKDIDIINADSLIMSLEYSFRLKDTQPAANYSFDQFCEYLLPYRVANEPLTYHWKWDCPRYAYPSEQSIFEIAKYINDQIHIDIAPEYYREPIKSFASILSDKYGKCDDRTIFVAMVLRSMGIAAAYDCVPIWGSHNNGHSFTSVILPDNTCISLSEQKQTTDSILFFRKVPKIYRYTYKSHNSSKYLVHSSFNNDRIDVTSSYDIPQQDIHLNQYTESANKSYLCVFLNGSWEPIAYSEDGHFSNLGTGELQSTESVDAGTGILYLPIKYVADQIVPISSPIVCSSKGIRSIEMLDEYESVTLYRKYPLNTRIVEFTKRMIRGVFEGSNKSDFSDAKTLHEISKTPLPRIQVIKLDSLSKYRYIRYRRPKGIFSIAELNVKDENGESLDFHAIGASAIEQSERFPNVFDKNPLTYFEVNGGLDLWVGADMRKTRHIRYIEFAPRNDDNAISPGDIYELFYWDNAWISLGVQTAIDFSLTYDNVPKGALLWLRNLTKGIEERPFTYENGKQIWW